MKFKAKEERVYQEIHCWPESSVFRSDFVVNSGLGVCLFKNLPFDSIKTN